MRDLYFLVPGTTGRYRCGGLFAELNALALAQQVCTATLVTYQQREDGTLFLSDLLATEAARNGIFVVSWGFHVPRLVRQLRGYAVVYHAHSCGYGFHLPPTVPIITVSRNSLGYWGQRSPHAPLFHLPNPLGAEFTNHQQSRDIDVLVQVRKSSRYLLQTLVPALEPHCRVVCLDHFVDDLAALFNRSRAYLYDSAEYWGERGLSEGFGLPPLEAMACGCQVFSSLNGALADYLDPGFNCHKIGVYASSYDQQRILATLQQPQQFPLSPAQLNPYRPAALQPRLATILGEINHFFDHALTGPGDVPGLSALRRQRLRLERLGQKLGRKLGLS